MSTEFFSEFGREVRIPIAYDLHQQTKTFEHMVEIEVGYTFSSDGFRTRDEQGHLCTSLIRDHEYGVISL